METADRPDSLRPEESLRGLVERVTFHSTETGFAVLRVKLRGHRDLATVVGTLPEVRAGEWLEARGRWSVDPRHGQQFRAVWLRTSPPDSEEGVLRYLASGLIKGVGPKLAERLVTALGTGVLDIIEQQPERLREVEGIGPRRQKSMVAAWGEQRAVRDIMVFLHGHGVATGRAFRIYRAYGDEAIETVSEDPYRLARDVRGIGFKSADQIAASLGIGKQSPQRARAGVEHVLDELTHEGHTGYERSGLVERAEKLLEIPLPIIEEALSHGLEQGRLTERAGGEGERLIYLTPLDRAEQELARSLVNLTHGRHPLPPIKLEKALEWVEGKVGLALASAQREAIRLAATSKVLVVTGGPGVGKTTLINSILHIFRAKGLKAVLAAPTGRAAKKLAEVTGLKASTIHRMLQFDPATGGFKHDAGKPLKGDVFVIDETSMVDVVLGYQTLRAVPASAALILVGDMDQLPSAGPGAVLRDIIDSGAVPVARLTEIFRQAARSAIVATAHQVNQGRMPRLPGPDGAGDSELYFLQANEPMEGVDLVVRLVADRLPARFGLDRLEDIQVLTPMQRGELGARHLNLALQQALNPEGPSVERFGWTYRLGDKVMQVVNNYDKDVFNGDIGRIVGLDLLEQEARIRFEERQVSYDFRELDELVLAYATTVHKAQGSEYHTVVLPVHTQHYPLLQRNLLYTAITRARQRLVLVGTRRAMAIAVGRLEAGRRVTLLRERLRELASRPPEGPGQLPLVPLK